MLFSIIVPVYNIKLYVAECIDSILAQNFRDFEVIIVDDGSTDGSSKICDDYEKRDDRIHVIHKKNGGLISARKAGAIEATGEYIINVDGDDYISSNFLQNLHEICKTNIYDVVSFGYILVDKFGRTILKRLNEMPPGKYTGRSIERVKSTFMYDSTKKSTNGGGLIFSVWSKAIKRDLFCQSLINVDERIAKGEDVAILAGVIFNGQSLYVSKFCDYFYRDLQQSMTHIFSIEDYIKQYYLRNYLLSIVAEKYLNQVYVFLFYCTYNLIQSHTKNMRNYREFAVVIEMIETYNLFCETKKMCISYPLLNDRIKIILIKKRYWKILYCYFRLF